MYDPEFFLSLLKEGSENNLEIELKRADTDSSKRLLHIMALIAAKHAHRIYSGDADVDLTIASIDFLHAVTKNSDAKKKFFDLMESGQTYKTSVEIVMDLIFQNVQ